jgi:hypothetical protein
LHLRNTWQLDEQLRSLVLSLKLARYAGQALGADGLQLYSDLLCVREPGGPDDELHVDAARMPVPGESIVAAYIPLSTETTPTPALELVSASHLMPECKEFKLHRSTTLRRVRGRVRRSGNPVAQASTVPGDVTFFSGNVFHRVRGHTGRRPTVSLWVYYVLAGQTLIRPRNPFQTLERDAHFSEINVGRPLLTPLTPLVWGRR